MVKVYKIEGMDALIDAITDTEETPVEETPVEETPVENVTSTRSRKKASSK